MATSSASTSSASDEIVLSDRNVPRAALTDELSRLYSQGFLTDVTLSTEDGKNFEAHRVLLAARSAYFHSVLPRLRSEPVVFLKGVKGAHLDKVLKFVYGTSVTVSRHQLRPVLEVARSLQVKGLKDVTPADVLSRQGGSAGHRIKSADSILAAPKMGSGVTRANSSSSSSASSPAKLVDKTTLTTFKTPPSRKGGSNNKPGSSVAASLRSSATNDDSPDNSDGGEGEEAKGDAPKVKKRRGRPPKNRNTGNASGGAAAGEKKEKDGKDVYDFEEESGGDHKEGFKRKRRGGARDGDEEGEGEDDDEEDGSPAPDDRGRQERNTSNSFEMKQELPVKCKNENAKLYLRKFVSGVRGRSIKYKGQWMTPQEFEVICGFSGKKYLENITTDYGPLKALTASGMLKPHPRNLRRRHNNKDGGGDSAEEEAEEEDEEEERGGKKKRRKKEEDEDEEDNEEGGAGEADENEEADEDEEEEEEEEEDDEDDDEEVRSDMKDAGTQDDGDDDVAATSTSTAAATVTAQPSTSSYSKSKKKKRRHRDSEWKRQLANCHLKTEVASGAIVEMEPPPPPFIATVDGQVLGGHHHQAVTMVTTSAQQQQQQPDHPPKISPSAFPEQPQTLYVMSPHPSSMSPHPSAMTPQHAPSFSPAPPQQQPVYVTSQSLPTPIPRAASAPAAQPSSSSSNTAGSSRIGNVLNVRCKSTTALLYANKYDSGSKGKCIQLGDEWLTPNEFEERAGSKAKKYLSSIKCLGRPLRVYVNSGELRGSGPPPPPKGPKPPKKLQPATAAPNAASPTTAAYPIAPATPHPIAPAPIQAPPTPTHISSAPQNLGMVAVAAAGHQHQPPILINQSMASHQPNIIPAMTFTIAQPLEVRQNQ